MKHTHQIHTPACPGSTATLLAGVLAVGILAVQAQTPIPGNLKAPPGSYNTGTAGFLIRTHQIPATRAPGDQNSIANVERELKGDFGPGIATNGPLSGYFTTGAVDFDVSRISPDFGGIGYNNYPFPGIDLDDLTPSPNYNNSNIVAEVIGFLELPAGNTTLTLRSDDSVRLTIGNGPNPYDFLALQPTGAAFDGSRGPANSTFTISVSSAGVYPIRIVYGQGDGGGTLEFSSTFDSFGTPVSALVNDPSWVGQGGLICHPPASLPITPTSAYVSYLEPYPGATGVNPLPTLVAEIKDSGTVVNTNGIKLSVNGIPVATVTSKSGGKTTITGSVTNLLTPNSVHTATLVYADSTPKSVTNTWSFTVQNYFPVPSSYAYPLGSGDATKRGFVGKIHVARANQSFNASIGRANAQLRDELIDFTLNPPTGAPYVNLVQTPAHPEPSDPNPVNGNGTFVNPNVINYSISAAAPNGVLDAMNFNSLNGYPDARYPGLPGWTDTTYATSGNVNAFAWEEIAWIELPQGLISIGTRAFDAVQVAIHRNDPRDLFREAPVWFDSNEGLQNRTGLLYVQAPGIYGFRIVQTLFGSADCQIEFFTANPNDANARTLVNDSTVPGAAKAFQALTVPSRPYVDSVNPGIASSGVPQDAPILLVLFNLGTNVPVLKVDGTPVAFATATVGDRTTLSYTNAAGWGRAKVVNVSVEYAGAVGAWSFQTKTGLKALVVGVSAGDTLISQRLASKFGLDVSNLPEGTVSANANRDYLMQFKMIWNSEAVSSGGARPYINFVRDNSLPIPAINVEGGNVSDWRLGTGSGNVAGGNANSHSVIITNAASPFAGGLAAGTNRVLNAGTGGTWHAGNGFPDTVFGLCATDLGGGVMPVYGFKAGTEGTQAYIHPARRVQFGLAGPGLVVNWNDNAWKMFDAAIAWVLPPKLSITSATAGNLTVSWTGDGVLEESATILAGSWTDSPNQANPQTRAATGTKFFRIRQ